MTNIIYHDVPYSPRCRNNIAAFVAGINLFLVYFPKAISHFQVKSVTSSHATSNQKSIPYNSRYVITCYHSTERGGQKVQALTNGLPLQSLIDGNHLRD